MGSSTNIDQFHRIFLCPSKVAKGRELKRKEAPRRDLICTISFSSLVGIVSSPVFGTASPVNK